MRFEFLQCFGRVIDQGETSCLSTTELGLETENVDLVLVGLVEFRKLGSQVVLGDVGTVGVEDITVGPSESNSRFDACLPLERFSWVYRVNLHDHLLTAEEGIADELARAQRDGLLAVRHLDGCEEVIELKVRLRCIIETDVGREEVDRWRSLSSEIEMAAVKVSRSGAAKMG